MAAELRRIRDWKPRDHSDSTTDSHQEKMLHIGRKDGNFYFNPLITFGSIILIWGFCILAMAGAITSEQMTEWQGSVTDYWNWLYMLSQNIWIVVVLWVMVRYWDLKLGADDDEVEFSSLSYFAMLFSCGVATGLFYFSAEAMWHYTSSKARWSDTSMFNDNTRAEHAMMVTFFHWGLHGWIPYAMCGALMSLMTYRRKFPMCMRFTLYPLIGEMCFGVVGDVIEILSILCTVFGVCTSLGLGVFQIGACLERLSRGTHLGEDTLCDVPGCSRGIQNTIANQILIIIIITAFATCSVVLGLKAGIQRLSMIAFVLSFFLLLVVLFMDETFYILNALTSSFGYYLWWVTKISFHTDAWEELGPAAEGRGGAPDDRGGTAGWMNGWTIFYWGWWISWAPFVGSFLARISKGRRMGEFIVYSLIIPSAWSMFFLGTIGAAQIRIDNVARNAGVTCDNGIFGNIYNKGNYSSGGVAPSNAVRLSCLGTNDVIFDHLSSYGGPEFGMIISIITLVAIVLYFVTSSDSASFIIDILASNGLDDPPTVQKVFWAFTEGLTAAVLLAAGGADGLNTVKVAPILLGLPFTFLLFWMGQALMIACAEDSGEIPMDRKNFRLFILNVEVKSLMSFVAPFVPLGDIQTRAFGGNLIVNTVGWAVGWMTMIIFFFLGLADKAFLSFGWAILVLFLLAVGALRSSVREKTGIDGGMISDFVACVLAFPFAIGQMAAEDMSLDGSECVSKLKEVVDVNNAAPELVHIEA